MFAQPQADDFAEEMRRAGEFLARNAGVNFNVAEGIEVFDLRLDFLLKETIRVRDDRASAGEQDTSGRTAALLTFVEIDRAGDLGVQPGHYVTDDLAHPRLRLALGLLVGASQSDEAM